MRVLLILPAYNEEENILRTVETIRRFQAESSLPAEVDYLVINDGSADDTEQVCRDHGIHCLSLVQNLGIGGAVQTGYLYAALRGYDIAVQFDGDGQHDVRSLGALIQPIVDGEADFTVGSRFLEEGSEFHSTFLRRVGIQYLSFLLHLAGGHRNAGPRIRDVTSGYRAANRKVLTFLSRNYPVDYPEPESLVTLRKNGFRIREVPVNMFQRAAGKSSIGFLHSIYYIIKVTCAILCAALQGREVRS